MKQILIIAFLLVSLFSFGQPTDYTKRETKENILALYARAMNIPAGTTPALTSGQWRGSGALFMDTTGGNQGLYMYLLGSWVRLADTTDFGSYLPISDTANNWVGGIYRTAGKDSIFFQIGSTTYAIKDSTGGGGGTNDNLGAGYRVAVPNTNDIKTLFDGFAIDMDSTTNADGITIKVDSNAVVKQGGNWGLGADMVIGAGSNHGLIFKTNNTNRVKIFDNGNLVGGTSLTDDGHSFRWSGNMSFNLGSDATGDMWYRNGSGSVTRIAAGSTGDVLKISGGLPLWAAPTPYVDSIWRVIGKDSIFYRMAGVTYQFKDSTGGGGGSYINNQTSVQASANFNIDGTGTAASLETNATIGTGVYNIWAGKAKTHFSVAGGAVGNTSGFTNQFWSGGNGGTMFSLFGCNMYWDGSNYVFPYAAGGASGVEMKPNIMIFRLTNSATQYAYLNTTEFGVNTRIKSFDVIQNEAEYQGKERSSPSAAPSGYAYIYPKTDGLIYSTDDAGTETKLTNDTKIYATYTLNADKTFATGGVADSIQLDTEDLESGITHSTASATDEITFPSAGVYTFHWTAHAQSASNHALKVGIQKWNGSAWANVANTSSIITVEASGTISGSGEFQLNLAASDKIRFVGSVTSTALTLNAITAADGVAEVPAFRVTIHRL